MNKENIKVFFNKNSKIIISIVVLLIMLVAATVAWYVLNATSRIEEFSGKISEWDFIVSDTPGGRQITENDVVLVKMNKFTNVKEGRMAPGTFGYSTLYIRATDIVTGYAITLDSSTLTFKIPVEGNDLSNENIDLPQITTSESGAYYDFTYLLDKHFRFYEDAECVQEIKMNEPAMGELTPNVEKAVNIYWKWLYDGSDSIPEDITDVNLKKEFLLKWDYEDNFISKYKQYIDGSIKIVAVGTQSEPVVIPGTEVENPTTSPSTESSPEPSEDANTGEGTESQDQTTGETQGQTP